MGCIYCIAGIHNLEEEHPDVWDMFMDGQFSVQKKEIPFVAIGIDQAGEQVNAEIKSQGGIIWITRNNNSRLRHFLIAPVVSTIYQEMYDMGMHHSAPRKRKNTISWERLTQIGRTSESLQCWKFSRDTTFHYVLKKRFWKILLLVKSIRIQLWKKYREKLYNDFVKERMQPSCTVSILSPLKKS